VTLAGVARAAFACGLLCMLLFAWLPAPPQLPGKPDDSLLHALAFGVLSGTAAIGFRRASLVQLGERLAFLGAIVELVQSLPVLQRSCEFGDWLVDVAAIMLTLAAAGLLRSRRAVKVAAGHAL
jgi:hypothetical protein